MSALMLAVPPARSTRRTEPLPYCRLPFCPGMRVLGVTTSLSSAAMEAARPDQILPAVGSIKVGDLTSLRYTLEQQQAQQRGGGGGGGGGAPAAATKVPA